MSTVLSNDHPANEAQILATRLGFPKQSVANTLNLLNEGATVPFIARYRKEITGSLDETAITAVRDAYQQLLELNKRREAVLNSLQETGNLSQDLKKQILNAATLTEVEDLYLPYRPKRKTKASMARERGLEPLAKAILANQKLAPDQFIDPERDVESKDAALAGALDIVAEQISEDKETRNDLRQLFRRQAIIESKLVKKNESAAGKYRDYFAWQEPAQKAPGHRILAMFRGETEKCLSLSIKPAEEAALELLNRRYIRSGPWQKEMIGAVRDSYNRLLAPSLENELRQNLKERADREAIEVFTANLRELLLAPLSAENVSWPWIRATEPELKLSALMNTENCWTRTSSFPPTTKRKNRRRQQQSVIL